MDFIEKGNIDLFEICNFVNSCLFSCLFYRKINSVVIFFVGYNFSLCCCWLYYMYFYLDFGWVLFVFVDFFLGLCFFINLMLDEWEVVLGIEFFWMRFVFICIVCLRVMWVFVWRWLDSVLLRIFIIIWLWIRLFFWELCL